MKVNGNYNSRVIFGVYHLRCNQYLCYNMRRRLGKLDVEGAGLVFYHWGTQNLPYASTCGFESRSWHPLSLEVTEGKFGFIRRFNDWRGVRVVDGATLERLCGRKSTGGSNPPLSAKQSINVYKG